MCRNINVMLQIRGNSEWFVINVMSTEIDNVSKIIAQFKKIVALSNLIQRIYHNDIRNMLP